MCERSLLEYPPDIISERVEVINVSVLSTGQLPVYTTHETSRLDSDLVLLKNNLHDRHDASMRLDDVANV
jgi:hypothetical protein